MRGMAAAYHHSRTTYTVLSLFVVAVIVLAFVNEPLLVSRVQTVSLGIQSFKKKKGKFPFPDFNRYHHTSTLSPAEFGLEHPGDRAIIIGDTHGMNRSLHNLLSTLSYDPHKDTLFLAGDILAKSSEAGSLAILDFLSQRRNGECFPEIQPRRPEKGVASGARKSSECKQVFAVRGNHDQMIVQWRAWRDWFEPLQLTFPSANLYPRRFSVPSVPSITSTQSATYDAGPPVGTGSQFLDLIESEWLRDRTADPSGATSDPQEWADTARKRAAGTWRAEWWKRIPQPGRGRAAKDWIMFSDHYWIARDMSTEQAEFLYSLPLIIHIPSEHFFLAHAGLLPLDPRRPATDERQPLAHLPSPDHVIDIGDADYDHALLRMDAPQGPLQEPDLHGNHTEGDIEELRIAQERSILHDVPHNRDPWVVLNMRGVRKSGKVTRRSDKGTPWAKIWNGQMKRCAGFKNATALDSDTTQEDEWEEDTAQRITRFHLMQAREKDGEEDEKPLPCYPSTVVYGHAASRDLDVRRWTVGLDTGCLYGRRLTSLVLQRKSSTEGSSHTLPTDDEDEDDDEEEEESSEEEEDELDEYATSDGPTLLGAVNARFARVAGGSAVARSRARQRKTWTRSIKFGDKASDLQAKLVSIKCPKAGDFAGP